MTINRLRIAKLKGKNRICFENDGIDRIIHNKSVLLVDSDETNLQVIRTFVEDLGIVVYTAADGLMALDIAMNQLPSIIVTEVNLPKMDGYLS
jgi:PleD family two-component response regulator